MYLVGVAVAILSGILLRKTLFRAAEELPFVMELPPFRRPSAKTIRIQVWQRTMGFVTHVWSIIMVASIVVWVLLNVPYRDGQPPRMQESLFGGVSRALSPVFKPAGFGNWQASGSLVTGLVAKEVVVSTMSQVYGVAEDHAASNTQKSTVVDDVVEIGRGFVTATWDTVKATASLLPGVDLVGKQSSGTEDTALQGELRVHFSPLQAVAFSIFVLLYTPCMATIGAMRQEFGTRWMWFSVFYMLVVAWIGAVLTYQLGHLVGLG
jgi:ferrous iron transport protein B